eukprot:2285473-Prymnesium_polylepis.1
MALNRLHAHLGEQRHDDGDGGATDDEGGAEGLYSAAAAADAEAEAAWEFEDDAPPRFWARATPLRSDEGPEGGGVDGGSS